MPPGRWDRERGPVYTGRLALKRDLGWVTIEVDGSSEDLRVAREDLGLAMDGDLVKVRVVRRMGRLAAVIEEVVERVRPRVVGTIDLRGREPVLLSGRATEPIRLVDLPAEPLVPNSLAVAEIVEHPSAYRPARARLVRILGEAGDPAVELEASRIAWNVPEPFPEAVEAAARAIPTTPTPSDHAGRMDFRETPVFTIDPPDARDFDDAISIVPGTSRDARGWTVGIHIADVSHFVEPRGVIDTEAYARATSTYLPGSVIPMLPERLSNGACSLVEGEDRLTVSILVEFDEALEPRSFRHGRSIIRSKRRFTYDEVDALWATGAGPFHGELVQLRRIAERLHGMRVARGAIDFDLPEFKPILDLEGKVVTVRRIERTWSHRLIEELMILANEHAARAMQDAGIYRVHEAPSPEKMANFRRIAGALGRGARTGSIPRILASFAESPARPVIEMMALRTMTEARYSGENIGHYGLASEAYSHFTSPIRRYPDLLAHRILTGQVPGWDLKQAAFHSSKREREAMEAERDALRIKLLEYAETMLGEQVKGVIDGVSRDGIFVMLEVGPRGMVRMDELGREQFHYDRDTMTLTGRRTHVRYQVGQPIEVVLASVDLAGRQLYLVPAKGSGSRRDEAEAGRRTALTAAGLSPETGREDRTSDRAKRRHERKAAGPAADAKRSEDERRERGRRKLKRFLKTIRKGKKR